MFRFTDGISEDNAGAADDNDDDDDDNNNNVKILQ